LTKLEVPRLGLAAFSRRILVRSVFALLILATLALAVVLLQEEKERGWRNYAQSFKKTQSEIAARLRHPAGQLALQNPERAPLSASEGTSGQATTPLRPLVLPYGGLDFDDQSKAQQAIETAGCNVQYPDGSRLCVAVGNNAYAGGYLYVVGSFNAPPLVARERGALALGDVHRAQIVLNVRGETLRWVAPYEIDPTASSSTGRLTGFADTYPPLTHLPLLAKPQRDFRGWLWQGPQCAQGADAACLRRAFFSIRLPVEPYRAALFRQGRVAWPPPDLADTTVHLRILGPSATTGTAAPLFDSNAPGATVPQALSDLTQTLSLGETLTIHKAGGAEVATLRGDEPNEPDKPNEPGQAVAWLTHLIRALPVDEFKPLQGHELITTPAGNFDITLTGSAQSAELALGTVAARLSWVVAAMLAVIVLAWAVIEVGLLRRVKLLTRRAAAVSYNVNALQVEQRVGALDVADLRGKDELGILAGALADLLQRVKDDVAREHIRAGQERDMWHAVGHEIMSPLQSLMVLHPQASDTSHRYVQRMQQAVKVLYGQASPSEALQAATLPVGTLDLDAFLRNVATNAPFAGVEQVIYLRPPAPVTVRGDDFSLEDVVTHILANAHRHRHPGTPITLTLTIENNTAQVTLHNTGAHIPADLLDSIFDYGVSGANTISETSGQRGQGLFVVKTYMAKMGGTVQVRNVGEGGRAGVEFGLVLQIT
jgi:signal transduction histidine kinase